MVKLVLNSKQAYIELDVYLKVLAELKAFCNKRYGSGFRGLGFGVWGLGFGVWGLGFTVVVFWDQA